MIFYYPLNEQDLVTTSAAASAAASSGGSAADSVNAQPLVSDMHEVRENSNLE